MRITVLIENISHDNNLLSEWGLALWVERDKRAVLFDCGQSNALLRNANRLTCDLTQTTDIVLSHGHYDHSGGLACALPLAAEQEPAPRLFMHPDATATRFNTAANGRLKDISIPKNARNALAAYPNLKLSRDSAWLYPDMLFLGEIPRRFPELCRHVGRLNQPDGPPDPLNDDSGLAVITPEGLVIITGCAHAGVANIVEHACAVTAINKVCAVIGGLHMHEAPANILRQTLNYLESKNVRHLYSCHCSGQLPQSTANQPPIFTGSRIELP